MEYPHVNGSLPPATKRIKVEHVASSPTSLRNEDVVSDTLASASVAPVPVSSAAESSLKTSAAEKGTPTGRTQTAFQQESRDNFDSLIDVMGASGVDLRAEEEAIQQRDLYDPSQASSQTRHNDDELYLQVYPLAFKVHTIAQKHGLGVDAAVLNYLSLAARMRFKNLLEMMVASSRHRTWSSHQHPPPMYETDGTTPMYYERIISDPFKQLAALEKAERGDETKRRRERLARDQQAAAAVSGNGTDGADGEGDDSASRDGKRKHKKIGPAVAARNMSEDVRKKLTDGVANYRLGGAPKYSWLQGGGAFSSAMMTPTSSKSKSKEQGADENDMNNTSTPHRLPKPKFAPQPLLTPWKSSSSSSQVKESSLSSSTKTPTTPGAWGDVAARQAAKDEQERKARLKVTIRDALFALEFEQRGGSGYGSGETLLYRIRAGASAVAKAKP